MKTQLMTAALVAAFLHPHVADACATTVKNSKKVSWKEYYAARAVAQKSTRKPADIGRLPYAKLEPWGGGDKSKWKPEAILANAVSEALNDGFAESNAKDVLVSVPVQMRYSGERVYGDGQTNAAVEFGEGWTEKEPVVIATLVNYKDGTSKLKFRFHFRLGLAGRGVKLVADGKTLKEWKTTSTTADGDYEVEWKPSKSEAPKWGDLFANRVAFLQPAGWDDWFPIDFRDVVKSNDEMLAQIPKDKQRFGKGTLIDPQLISVQGKTGDEFPFQLIKDAKTFVKDINGNDYYPDGIHHYFPGVRATAVGAGTTFVMENAPAPFKLAYICFDARNRKAESQNGVPSGAGWHEVGDEAETVFNSLERAPVVFGYANSWPASAPPSGKFAYGLHDVSVIRKLMPGSAIVTATGRTTYCEDHSPTYGARKYRAQRGEAGRNYHWFIFDHPHSVCALEWVHPNVPAATNNIGMNPIEKTKATCPE